MTMSPAASSADRVQRRLGHSWLSHIWLLCLLVVGLHSAPAQAQNAVVLVGSGSSVPAPLYTRWTQEYGKHNSHIQMRYLPVGTSEGIKQISHGVGDFGAGEAQLTDSERKDGLIEMPVVLIGIVPIYNLPDVHQDLRLTGEVLAEIFLGEIKNWNAVPIAKLNPEITLPNLPIQVINRPCGQGLKLCVHRFSFQNQLQVSQSSWSQSFSEVADRCSRGAQRRYGGKGKKYHWLHWIC